MAQTGLRPSVDMPAAKVTQCCSAMPTSKARSGKRSKTLSMPVPSGIAAVSATTRSSRSISSQSVWPKTAVYCGGAGLAGLTAAPVLRSNGPVACHA
jgi:hypothetical protein